MADDQKRTIKFSKKILEVLKKRFDPSLAKETDDGQGYSIEVECPLCKEHFSKWACESCPFDVLRFNETPGCLIFIRSIIPYPCFLVCPDEVFWEKEDDAKARAQLDSLRKKARELLIERGDECEFQVNESDLELARERERRGETEEESSERAESESE